MKSSEISEYVLPENIKEEIQKTLTKLKSEFSDDIDFLSKWLNFTLKIGKKVDGHIIYYDDIKYFLSIYKIIFKK